MKDNRNNESEWNNCDLVAETVLSRIQKWTFYPGSANNYYIVIHLYVFPNNCEYFLITKNSDDVISLILLLLYNIIELTVSRVNKWIA